MRLEKTDVFLHKSWSGVFGMPLGQDNRQSVF
jgi:hypothetical protein